MARAQRIQETPSNARRIARTMSAELDACHAQLTKPLRAIRRKYSLQLQTVSPVLVRGVAQEMLTTARHRWVAYELIRYHQPTFRTLTPTMVTRLGRGIDSWWTVDAFARTLAGPLWLRGELPDTLIAEWAENRNIWWRRAALVSTVALNIKTDGGKGDARRTLTICQKLVSDHHPMVVKGLSWALRELVPRNPEAVARFVGEYKSELASLVKREVSSKLHTGLKTPRRRHISIRPTTR